jgi:RND family efflux transporter MFP subunit
MPFKTSSFIVTGLSALSILAALSFNATRMGPAKPAVAAEIAAEATSDSALSALPEISVTSANIGAYQAEIVGFGEARAMQELTLTSEVTGKITALASDFNAGQIIPRDTIIAQLDPTNYRQALASAQATLAQAQLNLLEEERQSTQALNEWNRSGIKGQPASPLVLRTPQLALAKANVTSAKADVAKAQRDLDNTSIRAPFDALVVSRDIQPGSVLQNGSQVATLFSVDEVEIRVPLNDAQWSNLPNPTTLSYQHHDVKLTSTSGEVTWHGTIARVEQHLSSDTRQRALIVSVTNPFDKTNGLYPGTFVKAEIRGQAKDNLWEVPASAISQQGEIWFVEGNGELHKTKAYRTFDIGEQSYVKPLDITPDAIRQIVKRPLSHFQEGMLVSPKQETI